MLLLQLHKALSQVQGVLPLGRQLSPLFGELSQEAGVLFIEDVQELVSNVPNASVVVVAGRGWLGGCSTAEVDMVGGLRER